MGRVPKILAGLVAATLTAQSASTLPSPFPILKDGCYEIVGDMRFCAENLGWRSSMGSHPDVTAYFVHDDARMFIWHYDFANGVYSDFNGAKDRAIYPPGTWITDGKIAFDIQAATTEGGEILRDETRTVGAHVIRSVLYEDAGGAANAVSDFVDAPWALSVETRTTKVSPAKLWEMHQAALDALHIEK